MVIPAHASLSRPIKVKTNFSKCSKVIHGQMLIDYVKSFIIPIYTHEVTAFPRLEIFVKYRSLYDNLARYVTNKNADENSQSSLQK